MSVTKAEVLKLYKSLLTYSKSLSLTDIAYYKRRITHEFKHNRTLTKPEDISKAFKVGVVWKHTLDYSKVPKISEGDLAEQFVRGGGPGGSAVNKNANCVVLTHIPTGIVIKCHISRSQDENRKLAREMLIAKLDNEVNGESSVAAQKKKLEEEKFKKADYKKKKKAKLKEEWKKREGF